jgi:hypothetical protein
MNPHLETLIELIPAMVSFGVVMIVVYIVTSNDGDDFPNH